MRPAADLLVGDSREVLATLAECSVDSVVTDPPYGLTPGLNVNRLVARWLMDLEHREGGGFMGATWDEIPGPATWREVVRVMKPGAYLLAFAGTRTVDLMGLSLRLAGLEVQDCVMWLYGTGFPKSHNVSKAIDKAAGAAPGEVIETRRVPVGHAFAGEAYGGDGASVEYDRTEPVTPEAIRWKGWGSALKPGYEPVLVCRKPSLGTIAAQMMATGTGAINVDACRLPMSDTDREKFARGSEAWARRDERLGGGVKHAEVYGTYGAQEASEANPKGRWPANVVLDEAAAAQLDAAVPAVPPKPGRTGRKGGNKGALGAFAGSTDDAVGTWPADPGGGPSRFYYCAKASTAERGEGNDHPTVKPQALMRWLCRLVTQPDGLVLDPFAGSGSTLLAARAEGFRSLGIEGLEKHAVIVRARLAAP